MTALAPRPRFSSSADDEALVDAALDGDELAWMLLTDLHVDSVRAVAMARLRDEHAADDVVQETLVRAWTRLHQLDEAHKLGAWLKTIAANVAIDHLRAQRPAEVLVVTEEPLGAHSPVEDHVVERDEARILHGHLAQLREQDRVALWQRDALGAPIADVASRLGMTDGSVRVLLTRARGKVRAGYAVVVAPLVGLGLRLRARAAGLGEALPVAVVAPALVVAATVGVVVPDWGAQDTQVLGQTVAVAPATTDGPMLVGASGDDVNGHLDEMLVRQRPSGRPDAAPAVVASPTPQREPIVDLDHDGVGTAVTRDRPDGQDPDVETDAPERGPVETIDVYVTDTIPAGGSLFCTGAECDESAEG